ncbi:MAG: 16S rRNA (uracil(1498)-N(3))-methyltransferase [Lachnospiraceae bacterium]|nr:16S rRNA (uracil(1498)-N(3))-methyltransferase [Lachnospiraceae bacterium]
MFQFFVRSEKVNNGLAYITGDDYHHLKDVVRLKAGDKVRISIDTGENYIGVIEDFTEDAAIVELTDKAADTELKGKMTLFQGMPKSDKFEFIIEKAVELGVTEIVPTMMEFSVVKIDEKKIASKVERWQKIAEAAAKQSKRSIVPQVLQPMKYKDAVEYAASNTINLVPYENESGPKGTIELLKAVKPEDSVGIFIGPEGGFSEKEIELAREKNMKTVSLGRRILRTETAALTALSLIMMNKEE